MTYDSEMVDLYLNMVVNRHTIWEKRQAGLDAPWTDDPILARLKMTNMFRVLDPGSQFVLTDLACDDDLDFLVRCVFYRITNLPATWHAMRQYMGRYPVAEDFSTSTFAEVLIRDLHHYRDAGNKIFSGAYIIIPNPGVTNSDKVVDAVRLVQGFVRDKAEDFLAASTQRDRFNILRSTNGLGKFLSMQILTDWGYAQDVNREHEFIVAGPGAVRGAAHLIQGRPAENVIWDLTAVLFDAVTLNGHLLGPMNIQNTLCEFSKYVREINTPRKTSIYKPAHPGRQPKPVLPVWMQ